MKIPASARLLLDFHGWVFDPERKAYVKDGTTLHLNFTRNQTVAVQLSKMSAVWSSIVPNEDLDQIIRTAKPIRN